MKEVAIQRTIQTAYTLRQVKAGTDQGIRLLARWCQRRHVGHLGSLLQALPLRKPLAPCKPAPPPLRGARSEFDSLAVRKRIPLASAAVCGKDAQVHVICHMVSDERARRGQIRIQSIHSGSL